MNNLPEKFLTAYNPKETEEKIYKEWEDSGYFNPDNLLTEKIKKDSSGKEKTFSIILPPPNVTGTLHIGHSLMLVIQDIIARYYRMNGYRTLWLPGTDHAAIATQSVVEKKLQKEEGKSRHDLGREKLLEKIEDFVSVSQNTILSQFKSMGASLDWSRLTFTLDEKRNFAVNTMFKKMYDDGLIYQGNRIVNWDPKGQTVISDDEIVYEERNTTLYTFKYAPDFPINISTTRPETKVGDTAVAVHPEDERYKEFVGKVFECNFCNVPIQIKIVADKEVDMEFGTGALGVTPAHSQIDWDIAERHALSKKQVINEYAKMINCNEELNGKKVTEAREIIVAWLEENNLLEKKEEVLQNVSTAERTGGIIEPLPKLQWFIAVNKEFEHFGKKTTLKKLMLEAVAEKGLKIIPERFEKVYSHWIENLRDWCISRQIWYGHRIPVWYTENGDIAAVGFNDTNKELKQDEDTLDTWFSSGMWTFSTLGWPEKTEDLKKYHPTTLMETGHDIIFFWVARMIMMSTYALNEIPFKTTYLHGLVRDTKGRKMSKSLNNALDPRELIERFGTDALRMSLIVGNGPGNDLKLSEDKIKAYKNFANKIWNATRFVLEKTLDYPGEENYIDNITFETDKKILSESLEQIKEIGADIENYRLHLASEKIYAYFWHEFCDKHIENLKIRILNDEEKTSAQATLLLVLRNLTIALHPFMPFVTEEIWKSLKNEKDDLLLVTNWIK
ncbi:MAG TPA: valine--tRNA ligase [Candidatus Paceibacterota bacterium]|nr:valine--tRNA ligase [Candidatus Paceibacterota bacterium]HQB57074.1 valine--tRNA ligase [Candidatus Paceibacterota bacterium]